MIYETMTDFIHPNIEEKDSLTININPIQQKESPISPPAPLTPSVVLSSSTYFLFESSDLSPNNNNLPWDWLPCSNKSAPLFFRKHSVNADGNDFSSISLPAATANGNARTINREQSNFWRRASEPNTVTYDSTLCTSCLNKRTQLFTPSCGQHQFCQACSTSQSLNLLIQGVCPHCAQTLDSIYNISNMHLATKFNNAAINANSYNVYAYQQSMSYPTSPQADSSSRNPFSTLPYYPCAKLSNIPWDISQNGVRHFFGNCRSPSLSVCTQSIHIMMDRTTGKTLSDAYVEFASISDLRRAIETRNQKLLKGRIVSVNECSQEELLSVVFPKWRGQFHGTLAIPPASEVVRTMSTAAGGGISGCPPFITREEINSLLVVCKNYKLHFSRKCAERPFENIISIIAKYPWQQSHLITTMHRDHIYEMLKLSIESLKTHLSKDYVQIDPTLLERLTRAGIMCPAFTERQKTTLLQTACIDCPADIESFLISSNGATISLTPPGFSSLSIQSPITPPITEYQQHQYQQPSLNINTKQLLHPFNQQLSRASSQCSWEQNNDSGNEDDELNDLLLSPSNSPISSLIRDIQHHCYFDEKPVHQQTKKPSVNKEQPSILNNGIPLLLQPITNFSQASIEQHYQQISKLRHQQKQDNTISKPGQQLSPWAPSYAPKAPSADIWRMSTSIESNHGSSKSPIAS